MHATHATTRETLQKHGHLDGRSEILSFVGTLSIQTLVSSCTNFFHIAWIKQFWSKFLVAPVMCHMRLQTRKSLAVHIYLFA